MADFQKALKKILKWEGGFVDNPNDKGGATNKGITLQTYRSKFGSGKTKEDLLHIKDEEVEKIYRENYWDIMRGDYIANQSLAELIFDFIVNSGVGKLRQVQGVCQLLPDGKIGSKSIDRFNSAPKVCFQAVWDWRKYFYNKIGVGNQKVFLKGWLNRLNSYTFVETSEQN